MATVTVSTNQGTLINSSQNLLDQMAPYANLTLKARIEPILNYYNNINKAVSNDYSAGGYLKYGLLPNGQFQVDLDGFSLWYTGTFSQSGSLVTSIVVKDLSNGYVVQVEGSIAYAGVPFFTGINGASRISSMGYINASSTEASSLQVNATINSNSIIAGQITAMAVQFVDASGKIVTRDFTSGGNVAFTNETGSFSVLSGGFTTNSLDNRSYPLNNPDTLLDYVLIENFYMPITATTATFNAQLLSGNDTFTLIGSRGSSVDTGGGNDTVLGSLYSDTVLTQAGNDVITGGGGNDAIDGGNGIDTAVYSGISSQYQITAGMRATVIDKTANRDGTDTLTNVERLKFSDTSLALDISKDQTAGSGYMLYKAAFNRTPDAGGLGYWISKMDSGVTYSSVAQSFVNSAEFKTAFGGSNPSVNTLVTKLYNNVLNRTPDAGGLTFWQDKLNTGWSTADVLGFFSTSGENVTNVTPLIANGISYTQYVG